MLGIEDFWVWFAYVLSVGSAVLCVVYSWVNWNRGDDSVRDEDIKWAKEEDKMEGNPQ